MLGCQIVFSLPDTHCPQQQQKSVLCILTYILLFLKIFCIIIILTISFLVNIKMFQIVPYETRLKQRQNSMTFFLDLSIL